MSTKATRGFSPSFLFVISFCFVSIALVHGTAFAAGEKVEVCHVPLDSPDNFHTIRISANALSNHLGHADLSGACDGLCAAICDDGDACTVDDTADCEDNGCPAFPEPVDCNDGNLCTTDSCDSIDGCQNTPVTCPQPDMCNVAACDPVDGSCSVLTPVTCPPGYSCDPEVGCVEDEPEPECPCFSEADLQAQGGIYQCGEGYIAEGVINYFLNANYYCSGTEGCTQDNLGNPVTGCATLTDYDSDLGTWLNQSGMAISDAEDSACRAALLATCSAQSSLTSQAQSDGGPVDLPAATTVDP